MSSSKVADELVESQRKKEAALKIQSLFRQFRKKKQETIRQIQWMTGSNGTYTLPALVHTHFTLMPTGQLLINRVAPMCGERYMGVSMRGINQTCLSGVARKNFELAWQYASSGTNFNIKQREESVSNRIRDLIFTLNQDGSFFYRRTPMGGWLFHGDMVTGLADAILSLRQINETRYQKEFAEGARLVLSKTEDNARWQHFQEAEKVKRALSLEIPPDMYKAIGEFDENKVLDFFEKNGLRNKVWYDEVSVRTYPGGLWGLFEGFGVGGAFYTGYNRRLF